MANLNQETIEQIGTTVQQKLKDAGLEGISDRLSDMESTINQVKGEALNETTLKTSLDARLEEWERGRPDDDPNTEQIRTIIKEEHGNEIEKEVAKYLASLYPQGTDKEESPFSDWKNEKTEYSRDALDYCTIDLCHERQGTNTILQRAAETMAVGSAIVGAPVQAFDPWTTLVAGNPLRPYMTVVTVTSSGFKLPKFDRGTAGMNKNVTPTIPTGSRTGRNMTAPTIAVDDFEKSYPASDSVEEDIPGIRNVFAETLFEDYAFEQGKQAVAVLKAAASSGQSIHGSLVKTGAAATLGDDIAGKLTNMLTGVPTPYRMMNVYQVSRFVEGALVNQLKGSAGFALLPTMMINSWNGYPIIPNDHIDDTAAGAIVGYFGNFRKGIFCGERRMLTIEEHNYPGATLYYARCRFKHVEWDLNGVVGLAVGA